MEIIQTLLLVLYAIYAFFICTVLILAAALLYPKGAKKLKKTDWPIELAYVLAICFAVYFGQFILGIKGFLLYVVAFGLFAMLMEYVSDWLWLRLMGEPIYIYKKKAIMGMTSIWNLPYWIWGSIFFYFVWKFLGIDTLDINPIIFGMYFLACASFGVIIYLTSIAIIDGMDGIPDKMPGFMMRKYIIFPVLLWSGIVGSSFLIGSPIIILYALVTTIVGFLLEGILGQILKFSFGEDYWIYTRKPVIGKSTSWLLLPLWAIASTLALLLLSIFMI